ncbi:unnamed protein product [Schistocephalus solidus]|uniref:PI3K/PI4K domain-containing protein n=1 Tax=Schistocephalus solidus TaxID=70667 RepID=A0A183T0L9_SCHSO|nr:unnamed protein product [Schistocephalus solidus]
MSYYSTTIGATELAGTDALRNISSVVWVNSMRVGPLNRERTLGISCCNVLYAAEERDKETFYSQLQALVERVFRRDLLIVTLHEMIKQVMRDKVIPDDWGSGILELVLKKGDKKRREDYRSISLTDVAVKIFAIVLPW